MKGEVLVAIDILENHGDGIPYFQVEYILKLCSKLKFQRFHGCIVYLVVVSDGQLEADAAIESRLLELIEASTVKARIRMYRLNTLRAKYGI